MRTPFDKDIAELWSHLEVVGIAVYQDRKMLLDYLPYSEERSGALARLLDRILLGYAQSQRRVRRLLFGYDDQDLLVICYRDLKVAALLEKDGDVDEVTKSLTQFIYQHRKHLIDYHEEVEKVFDAQVRFSA